MVKLVKPQVDVEKALEAPSDALDGMRDEYCFDESKPNPYASGRIGAMRGKWDGFDYEGFQALDDVLAEALDAEEAGR